MRLKNGTYRTAAGSTVTISGECGGIIHGEFDWFEEDGVCCPDTFSDADDEGIHWYCASCEQGGIIPLAPKDSHQLEKGSKS